MPFYAVLFTIPPIPQFLSANKISLRQNVPYWLLHLPVANARFGKHFRQAVSLTNTCLDEVLLSRLVTVMSLGVAVVAYIEGCKPYPFDRWGSLTVNASNMREWMWSSMSVPIITPEQKSSLGHFAPCLYTNKQTNQLFQGQRNIWLVEEVTTRKLWDAFRIFVIINLL